MKLRTLARGPVWVLLAATAGCAPQVQAPVKVMALVPSKTHSNTASQVTLTTVTDLLAMKGSVADFSGGAQVTFDANDPLLNQTPTPNDSQLKAIISPDPGVNVRGNFIFKDDVYWPADFHTWAMVTTYWNFEKSYAYFKGIYGSQNSEELLHVPVLYWASFRDVARDPKKDQVDNALFFSLIKSFLILPFEVDQKVPFSMNLGVIGHEYAHWVFNKRVYGGQAFPAALNQITTAVAYLKAFDEGLADFHGYGVTCTSDMGCNTSSIEISHVGNDATARDFGNAQPLLEPGLRNEAANDPAAFLSQSHHYVLGTVLAATLFQAINKAAMPASRGARLERMQKALIAAYDDDTVLAGRTRGLKQLFADAPNPAAIKLEAFIDVVAGHLNEANDTPLRQAFCGEAIDRLHLNCGNAAPGVCATMPNCATYPVSSQCND